MRHCRICNRNYADDDTFCAVDGSMLQMGKSPESAVPVHQQPGPPSTPEAPRIPSVPDSEGKMSSETGNQNDGVEKKG